MPEPQSEDAAPLTDEQRRLFRDEGVRPEGWIWCPECNGEGVITTMDASPHLDEHTVECRRCTAELGIVPFSRCPTCGLNVGRRQHHRVLCDDPWHAADELLHIGGSVSTSGTGPT